MYSSGEEVAFDTQSSVPPGNQQVAVGVQEESSNLEAAPLPPQQAQPHVDMDQDEWEEEEEQEVRSPAKKRKVGHGPIESPHPPGPSTAATTTTTTTRPADSTATFRLDRGDAYLWDKDGKPLHDSAGHPIAIDRKYESRSYLSMGQCNRVQLTRAEKEQGKYFYKAMHRVTWTPEESLRLYQEVQKVPIYLPGQPTAYVYNRYAHLFPGRNSQQVKDKMRSMVAHRVKNKLPVWGSARHYLPSSTEDDGLAVYKQERNAAMASRARGNGKFVGLSDVEGDEEDDDEDDDDELDSEDETMRSLPLKQQAKGKQRQRVRRDSFEEDVVMTEVPVRLAKGKQQTLGNDEGGTDDLGAQEADQEGSLGGIDEVVALTQEQRDEVADQRQVEQSIAL